MSSDLWVGVALIISGIVATYNVVKILVKKKSITFVFFLISILAFTTGSSVSLFPDLNGKVSEWSWILSVTFLICALFGLVRDSKPVFARFPVFLTYLPLVSVIFYPLAIDAAVIKNLILSTYQAGALVVAILLFSVKQKKERGHLLTLAGILLAVISFMFYWLISIQAIETKIVSAISMPAGIILVSFGLTKKY